MVSALSHEKWVSALEPQRAMGDDNAVHRDRAYCPLLERVIPTRSRCSSEGERALFEDRFSVTPSVQVEPFQRGSRGTREIDIFGISLYSASAEQLSADPNDRWRALVTCDPVAAQLACNESAHESAREHVLNGRC